MVQDKVVKIICVKTAYSGSLVVDIGKILYTPILDFDSGYNKWVSVYFTYNGTYVYFGAFLCECFMRYDKFRDKRIDEIFD